MAGVKTPRMVETVPALPAPEPWERREDEPLDAWEAFQAYRDMPPDERRIRSAAAKKVTTLDAWSKKYEWRERVKAYDAVFDQQRTAERLLIHKRKAAEIATDHMLMLADARELVTNEIAKLLEASRSSPMHGLIKPADLIRLGTMVIQFDRLIRNQTTEQIGHSDAVFDAMSAEELDTMNEILGRAAKKSEGEGGTPPPH